MTWKLKHFHIFIHGDLVTGTMDVLYPIMHTAKCVCLMLEDGLLVINFTLFFRYDCMTKMRLRMTNARRVVKVGNLQESLDAGKVKTQDPYTIYGSQVPRVIPGSKQYWKSFGLDLVAFVQQRGLPDFFVTLTAFDGWPHVQTALARGWGAIPNEDDIQDLAKKIEDRQPVGSHPEYSVIAAEKRFYG